MNTIYLYDDEIGSVEYIDHMGTDITIVNAARASFNKHVTELDDRDKKLITYLAKHRHTSVFEHNLVTLRFKVPLFVRSQHHRHRTWSYNEISRRYTAENIQFYAPREFRSQHKSNRQASNPEGLINPWIVDEGQGHIHMDQLVREHHQESIDLYNLLMEKGVCREQARGVLPQNMYTTYYGTVNLNNLIKFISLRTHEGAQQEIQVVAQACLSIASELWPVAVAAYRQGQ